MGQVALDLPDPLNSSSPAGPGVDDLLAQLAGEEIDRLLAEADVERPARTLEVIVPSPEVIVPTPAVSASPVSPAATVSNVTLAPSAADPAQSHIELEPAIPSGPIAEADVDELDARVAQELNNLFTELDGEKPKEVSAPQSAPAPVAAVAPAAPIEVPIVAAPPAISAAPSDPVAQAQALEKQLMGKALLDALGGPGETQTATGGFRSINLSFLLRPLEWVNAPLSACSDASRETMGKVAIMTLINALAVLLYVLFVRRH